MKRYRFRLEKVLSVRRVQEEQAAAAVTRATLVLHEREADLAARRERLARRARGDGPLDAEDFDRLRWELETAAQSVVHGEIRRFEASTLVGVRLNERAEANRRVTALERLDEKRRDEHLRDLLREEVGIADEQTTNRLLRRGQEPS